MKTDDTLVIGWDKDGLPKFCKSFSFETQREEMFKAYDYVSANFPFYSMGQYWMNIKTITPPMEYKEYKIIPEDDPWMIKYGNKFRFYKDEEFVRHAETIEEAKDEIDELVNSQS